MFLTMIYGINYLTLKITEEQKNQIMDALKENIKKYDKELIQYNICQKKLV